MANPHFYPPIEPFDSGHMEADAPHRLYFEQCGNPQGDPILFLHGGPGAGCSAFDRCRVDFHIDVIDADRGGQTR